MVDLGLYNFIKNAFARKQTEAEVRETLTKAGWAEVLITEAIEAVKRGDAPSVPHAGPGGSLSEHSEHVEEVDETPQSADGSWFRRAFPMYYGRIGVGGFWKSIVVELIFALALWALLAFFGFLIFSALGVGGILARVASIIVFVVAADLFLQSMLWFFSWGVSVRRLHDLGLSGWTLLGLMLLPLVGGLIASAVRVEAIYIVCTVTTVVFAFVIMFWPGSAKANRYGPFQYYTWTNAYFGEGSVGKSLLVALAVSLGVVVVYGIVVAVFTAAFLSPLTKFVPSLQSLPTLWGQSVGTTTAATTTAPTASSTLGSLISQPVLNGRDAAIQSDLHTIQMFAVMYYNDNGGSYGVASSCATPRSLFSNPSVASAIRNLESMGAAPLCKAQDSVYAVEAASQGVSGTYFCIDSTDVLKTEKGSMATVTKCP